MHLLTECVDKETRDRRRRLGVERLERAKRRQSQPVQCRYTYSDDSNEEPVFPDDRSSDDEMVVCGSSSSVPTSTSSTNTEADSQDSSDEANEDCYVKLTQRPNAIRCRGCKKWFHERCHPYNFRIDSVEDSQDPRFRYCCDDHRVRQAQIRHELNIFRSQFRTVRTYPRLPHSSISQSDIGDFIECDRCRSLIFPHEKDKDNRVCCGSSKSPLIHREETLTIPDWALRLFEDRKFVYEKGQEINQLLSLSAISVCHQNAKTGDIGNSVFARNRGGAFYINGLIQHIPLGTTGDRSHPLAGNMLSYFFVVGNHSESFGQAASRFQMSREQFDKVCATRELIQHRNALVRQLRATFVVNTRQTYQQR